MSTLTRHFDARITELKLVPGLSPAEGLVGATVRGGRLVARVERGKARA